VRRTVLEDQSGREIRGDRTVNTEKAEWIKSLVALGIDERDAIDIVEIPTDSERRAEEEKIKEITDLVRGGLTLVGYSHPLRDGGITFSVAEVLQFVEMREKVDADIDARWIAEFYTLWKGCEGHSNPKGSLRKIINPCKAKLINTLVEIAQSSGWTWGTKDKVVYFDTPAGQASFHLHWSTPLKDAPEYPGQWNGQKNSQQILEAFFSSQQACAA
jgi:hypothetical protein